MTIFQFFDSNFFQTLVVLITGFVALGIYYLTKRSEKRDSARIIIGEIQSAERAIQDIKNSKKITELSIILPADTWKAKKYLFLHDFDQDELRLLNDFYYKCAYAEDYRKLYFQIMNQSVTSKAIYLQEKLIDLMLMATSENQDNQEDYMERYFARRNQLIEMANNEDWLFEPGRPLNNLLDYIHNIQMLIPTTIGKKLKDLAQ